MMVDNKNQKKVLITGAHFTPAQAVIEEFKKYPDIEVVYVGRKYTIEGDKTVSVESQLLPKLGVKFIAITAGRLRRILDVWTIISLFKIPVGFIQAFFILLNEKPDIVLSFGGYTAVPVTLSAWLLSIPVIIHEQTLVSGLANKITSFFANKIAVTFKSNYSYTKEKIVITGNPIRKELFEPSVHASNELKIFLSRSSNLPVIYITGGNQGSHVVNKVVSKVLGQLTKKALVIHQTGDSKFADFRFLSETKNHVKNKERYYLKKFFDVWDLSLIFKTADLVISRAGVNTLLELAYFSIPTIVIPLPNLYNDEQIKNANYFEQLGLAEIIDQKRLNPSTLMDKIDQILANIKDYKIKARKATKAVIVDGDKRLVLETLILLKKTER